MIQKKNPLKTFKELVPGDKVRVYYAEAYTVPREQIWTVESVQFIPTQPEYPSHSSYKLELNLVRRGDRVTLNNLPLDKSDYSESDWDEIFNVEVIK